jgi:hypothetical protein
MKLTSPAFRDNEQIPTRYTCDGSDVNPPLEIAEVPPDTISLTLIFDDLDARAGDNTSLWIHWVLLNISSNTVCIEEGQIPEGAMQGQTSFGAHRYGGPCPPHGVHRYRFRVYALSKKLEVDRNATMAEIETDMAGHIIDRAEIMGTYCRQLI